MEKFKIGIISGQKWEVATPKAIVVISHGMAEHIERYDYFATKLNAQSISVFGINQLGHGDAIINDLKGHWEKNGFYDCVDNLKTLIDNISSSNKCPIILFGHSMGSFIAQEYIKKYGESIQCVILSGSSKTGLLHKMGRVISLFCLGNKTKPNNFLNGLSFGSYNKKFKPSRTEFDWLSRDNNEVDKYVKDPLCGYVCTTGFFKEFMKGLSRLNRKLSNIPTSLPIYIMSGSNDPVGNNGKDVYKLFKMYKDKGIKDVEMKLYEEGRHEMLNEINRDEVIDDITCYIKKHI